MQSNTSQILITYFSKEKVMKWLSCQSLNTDFGHGTKARNLMSPTSPKTSFSLQEANQFTATIDMQVNADQYLQSDVDQSTTSRMSTNRFDQQLSVAGDQQEVPKMEVKPFRSNSNTSTNNDDNLLKYIQQLQKRFSNLEQETNRVTKFSLTSF